jgi:hypothetical protein
MWVAQLESVALDVADDGMGGGFLGRHTRSMDPSGGKVNKKSTWLVRFLVTIVTWGDWPHVRKRT